MLSNNYPIKNYEDFKELFVREDGRRKNAVLLAWYKSRPMMSWIREKMKDAGQYDARALAKGFKIPDMSYLKDYVMWLIRGHIDYSKSESMSDSIWIPDWGWYASDMYRTDRNGLCFDRDYRSHRYVRKDNGRDFKMKMGRLFNHCIDCTTIANVLPREVRLWICEEVQRDWEMYTRAAMPPVDDCKLVVDDDFSRIYNGRYLVGDFGSCMTNRGHHYFYEESVKAKAARIEREDGMILARCVIFTEVKDEDTGEVFRLAERQYSSNGQDIYKQDLVRLLINGGHIDGYKKIGAGCGEADAFLDLNGNSMSGRRLSIECTASGDSTISYQDSFKWYDMRDGRAYNYDASGCEYYLDTTDEYLDGGVYDEYHDRYTHNDLEEVYYGRWMMCDAEELDDFRYIEGEGYIHVDYCSYCEQCEEYFRDGCGCYSEITGDCYCCESCRDDAEQEYKEENWHYSKYDDEWFEDEDDVTEFIDECGDKVSISVDSVDRLLDSGACVIVNGRIYSAEWAAKILEENA
jgi:hypothetical protein